MPSLPGCSPIWITGNFRRKQTMRRCRDSSVARVFAAYSTKVRAKPPSRIISPRKVGRNHVRQNRPISRHAKCSYCNSTIIIGGVRDGDLRFCNQKCRQAGALLLVSQLVPDEEVRK